MYNQNNNQNYAPQGGYPTPQQGGYAPAPQSGYPAPQQDKTYYSRCCIMHRPQNAPLDAAVFAVSGSIISATKLTGNNGNTYLSIHMQATLGDKMVAQNFGEEIIAPDHNVTFEFSLNGYQADNFCKYPPFYSQTVIVLLHNMSVNTYSKRDGSVGRNIRAYCDGYSIIGSSKKANGEVAKRVEITDKTNSQPQNGYAPASQGGYPAAPAPQQGGYPAPQQGGSGYAPAPPQGGGGYASMFAEIGADDGELPF